MPEDAYGLRLLGDQVHLDAMALAIVNRAVHEGGNVEIAAELAVDADQNVEIESRGNAGGVVIGVVNHPLVLLEVDADDHLRTPSKNLAGAAQEGARFLRPESAQRRPRKEADLGHSSDPGRQRKRRGETGGNR